MIVVMLRSQTNSGSGAPVFKDRKQKSQYKSVVRSVIFDPHGLQHTVQPLL